jgi:hypothetical protein
MLKRESKFLLMKNIWKLSSWWHWGCSQRSMVWHWLIIGKLWERWLPLWRWGRLFVCWGRRWPLSLIYAVRMLRGIWGRFRRRGSCFRVWLSSRCFSRLRDGFKVIRILKGNLLFYFSFSCEGGVLIILAILRWLIIFIKVPMWYYWKFQRAF